MRAKNTNLGGAMILGAMVFFTGCRIGESHEGSGEVSCVELYAPVCGADGTTYSNDCFAENAGVEIVHDGECDAVRTCESDAGCAENEFCDVPVFALQAASEDDAFEAIPHAIGTCEPKPPVRCSADGECDAGLFCQRLDCDDPEATPENSFVCVPLPSGI